MSMATTATATLNAQAQAASKEQDGYLVSKSYAWLVFIMLYALYLFDFIDRQVISALFPYLKKEWNLSDAQLGMLVSVVNISISVVVFPVALVVDRWSRKKSLAIMGILWSLATVSCAFTQSFGQLFTARMFIGTGEGGYASAAGPLCTALFPEKRRATILGILNSGAFIGGIVGVMLGGWIAVHYGWRHAFGIVGLPGFLIAVAFFFIRDYKTVPLEVTDKKSNKKVKMTKKEIVREFLGTRSLLLTYFGTAAAMVFTGTILNWTPTFFNRVYGLPMDQAGIKAAVIMIGSALGMVLGGFIVDKWKSKWSKAALVGPALFCLLTTLINASAFGMQKGPLQFPLILLGSLTIGAIMGPIYAVIQSVVHPGLRGLATSLNVLVINILGLAVGPLLTGLLSDKYEIQTAMTIVAFVPLIASVLFLIGAVFYDRDIAKTERVALSVE
ncbi:MAG TPA: MFS transporter [Syntrophobacteraceae bacterium]|jgi:MFS transporter, Spinster family, sphingosine-1-phosphate transporter|nr:MFS transporter [Syntrophobacteraceae bacterium]